ncbi:MAG: YceI family protein [Maribacter sp.]|nr:YceI family protein [Maribacter sp.]
MRNLIVALLVVFSFSLGWSQENYSLSEESTLTVDGTSTLHDWTVTANSCRGALVLDADAFKEISFEADVASIVSTRGATMDKKTHNALKKEEHPKVMFSAGNVAFSEGGNQAISGKLSVAGVAKDIVVMADIKNSDANIKLSGSYKITLQDYNMEPPKAMFGSIVVGDDVTVNFDLVFAKE